MRRQGNGCTVLNTHNYVMPGLRCLNTAAFGCESSWRDTASATPSATAAAPCSGDVPLGMGTEARDSGGVWSHANLSLRLRCCSWLCRQSYGLRICNHQHLQCWHPRWLASPRSLQRTCGACRSPGVPDHFCTTRF